jgi:hypothetical protein
MAFRQELTRSQQTLRLDLDDVPLSDLEILFPTLGDVPSETAVHRNDFGFGVSVTF